jgi:hypothetical protein
MVPAIFAYPEFRVHGPLTPDQERGQKGRMGLLDKAKDATGAAAERAAALKDRATSMVSDLTEQAASKASAVFDAGFGQIAQAVADFNGALPIVAEAGYALGEVSVEVSLSPKISASFTVAEALPDEQIERIESEHAESKLAVMIIRALHRASKLQGGLRIAGLRPMGLSIGIGLSPSVSIKFG